MYWKDGDREMGDYSKDIRIGKHAILTRNGNVHEKYY